MDNTDLWELTMILRNMIYYHELSVEKQIIPLTVNPTNNINVLNDVDGYENEARHILGYGKIYYLYCFY